MNDFTALVLSIILIFSGFYFFKKPFKLQNIFLNSLKKFDFLSQTKITSLCYTSLVKGLTGEKGLMMFKIQACGMIFMGVIFFLGFLISNLYWFNYYL